MVYVPAAGEGTETASSESPSADWATCLPLASYTVRSRSAAASETLPIATSRDLAPAGTSTVVVCFSPCPRDGRVVRAEPSGPPVSLPSRAAYALVTFQVAPAGTPAFASGTVTVAGSKTAP